MFLWNQIPDYLCTEFSFPATKSELFSNDSICLLSKIKLSSDDLKNRLSPVCDEIITSPLFILVHFNILASTLYNISDIPDSLTFEVLNTLIASGREINSFVVSISDNSNLLQTTTKQNAILTSCLMRLVYLVSEIFVEVFRLYFTQFEFRKRCKISKRSVYDSTHLMISCTEFLELTNSILSNNIMIIYSPPVPESVIDTIRVMLAPVYLILSQHTLLESLSLKLVQSIFLCLNSFPFLLIEVGMKISEVLQYTNSGQMLRPVIQNFLAQIVELIPNLCGQIIREITSRLHLDKDTPEARILGSVLSTLACCNHVQVESNLYFITPLLSADCYTLRNGALSALTEIIRGKFNTLNGSRDHSEICLVPLSHKDASYTLGGITSETLENKLFNTLVDHLFDINAFVRSRCIHLFNTLWESGSIPLAKQNYILELLIGRLLDKNAIVRKQSCSSIVMAIEKHPYRTATLDVISFQQCLQRELKILNEVNCQNEIWQLCHRLDSIDTIINIDIQEILTVNENVNMIKGDPMNEDCLYSKLESEISIGCIPDCIAAFDWVKRYIPDKTIFQKEYSNEQPIILSLTNKDLLLLSTIIRKSKIKEHSQDYMNKYKSQKLKVLYLHSAIKFIELMKSCLTTAINLLHSKIPSDVTSAIALLTEYRKSELPDHLICLNPILSLIWSQQQTHQDCALCCFLEFFIYKYVSQPDYVLIAQTLCKKLLTKINYRELYTIEKIVITLVKRKEFPHKLTMAIFNHIIQSQDLIKINIQTNALIILCMIGKGDPKILYDNIFILTNDCFTKNARDLDIGKFGCHALNIITSYQNKHKYNIERFINTHSVFNSILVFLSSSIIDCTKNWTCFMHEAMVLIIQLAQSPLDLYQLVISNCSAIFTIVLNEKKRIIGISRFLCLLGKVAQLQIIMLDNILTLHENSKSNQTLLQRDEYSSKVDEEPQMGLMGTFYDDASNSCYILEELIREGSILSKYTHIIVQIIKDQQFINFANKFTDNTSSISLSLILQLQSSALYALSQFMLLSNNLCEHYLNLVITLMKNHPCPYLRISCLNALADLTLRYPNTLQPWIPHVFMMLRDSNCSVRKHAILIISHLTRIDMVKLQGYAVEIAYLIYDEDASISELAHCFFSNIAQEGNSLYNVLPDIVSHMFDLENNYIEVNVIKQILKFLFSNIRKDRCVGNLVFKFLQRMKLASNNKQKELISFSISLLPISENTLNVLVNEFTNLKSVILDDQTKSHFINIYNIFRRQPNLHQGLKDLLNKYFELLNNITINEL